jgi:hypothetical protein
MHGLVETELCMWHRFPLFARCSGHTTAVVYHRLNAPGLLLPVLPLSTICLTSNLSTHTPFANLTSPAAVVTDVPGEHRGLLGDTPSCQDRQTVTAELTNVLSFSTFIQWIYINLY